MNFLLNISLTHTASPVVLNPMPIQEIYFGVTSLLTCSIDRGYPVGDVYWLRLDSTGDNIIAHVTPSYDPRFRIVEDGLQIEDVRSADEGLYRCFVQNSHGSDSFDIHAAFRGTYIHIYTCASMQMYIHVISCYWCGFVYVICFCSLHASVVVS